MSKQKTQTVTIVHNPPEQAVKIVPEPIGTIVPTPPALPAWLVAGDSKATAAKIRDLYGFTPSLRFADDLLDYFAKRDNV